MKVKSAWCYLYRAIDRDGNLVETMLSEKRNLLAATTFFKQAVATVGHSRIASPPTSHASYRRTVRHSLGRKVLHRTSQYLNNQIEQDHRGVKQRYYPMRGFGSFISAARFCTAFTKSAIIFVLNPRPPTRSHHYLKSAKTFGDEGSRSCLPGRLADCRKKMDKTALI